MQKFSNLAQTTLASDLGTSATTVTVTDASVFPALGASDWCVAVLYKPDGAGETGHEIVRVTAITGNDLTVDRGQESTPIGSFGAGDHIELRNTAGSMESLWDATQAETVATASAAIDRANGGIQTLTLTDDETLSVTISDGQSLTLHLSGGDTHAVTWPPVTWVGGSAPTLTAEDVIEFWQTGSTLYGAYVGSVA